VDFFGDPLGRPVVHADRPAATRLATVRETNAVLVALSESLIVVLVLVVLLAGALNGVAGFSFAIVGTMALATMIDPRRRSSS